MGHRIAVVYNDDRHKSCLYFINRSNVNRFRDVLLPTVAIMILLTTHGACISTISASSCSVVFDCYTDSLTFKPHFRK